MYLDCIYSNSSKHFPLKERYMEEITVQTYELLNKNDNVKINYTKYI